MEYTKHTQYCLLVVFSINKKSKKKPSVSEMVFIKSRVDSSGLVFSLSSHRHSFIGLVCISRWTLSHLIQLKQEYIKLVEDFNCDIQEFITVQDPPAPPSNILHLSPLTSLQILHVIWSYLSRENRERFNHRLNELYLVNLYNSWGYGLFGKQTFQLSQIHGSWSN